MFRSTIFLFLLLNALTGLAKPVFTANIYFDTDRTSERPFQKCWELRSESVVRSIISHNDSIVFTEGKDSLRSVERSSGLSSWRTETGGEIISNLVSSENKVFLIVSQSRSDTGNEKAAVLMSVNVESGITDSKIEVPYAESYLLEKSVRGIVSLSSSGSVSLIDSQLSSIMWHRELGKELLRKPSISGNIVGIILEDKSLLAIDLLSGGTVFSKTLENRQLAIELRNERLLFVGDERGAVRKFDITRNIEEWAFKSGGAILSLDEVRDSILVSSSDNFLYLLSSESGKVEWRKRLSGRARSEPLINDKLIYLGAYGDETTQISLVSSGKTVNRIDPGSIKASIDKPVMLGSTAVLLKFDGGFAVFDQDSCKK